MADICELSDLPVDQCACRVHAHAETEIDADPWRGAVVAKYDDECIECHEEVRAGVDLLVFTLASGWVHKDCAD